MTATDSQEGNSKTAMAVGLGASRPARQPEGVRRMVCFSFEWTGSSDVTLSKMYCPKELEIEVNRKIPATQGCWCSAAAILLCWMGGIAWKLDVDNVAIRSQWGAAGCRMDGSEAKLGRHDAL